MKLKSKNAFGGTVRNGSARKLSRRRLKTDVDFRRSGARQNNVELSIKSS